MANPDQLDIDIEAHPLVRAARLIQTIHEKTLAEIDAGQRMLKTEDGVTRDVTEYYTSEVVAAIAKGKELIERVYRAGGVTTESASAVKELEGFDTPFKMTMPPAATKDVAETRESADDVADDATHAIHLPGDR